MEQGTLAKSISEKIPYEFNRSFLVKPLPVEKVTKEFTVPVEEDKTSDENGVEAVNFSKTKTEVKEVDSDFQKGIVLKIPHDYKAQLENAEDRFKPIDIRVGDTLIFRRSCRYFDLIKDTRLIELYDIIAVEKTSEDTETL